MNNRALDTATLLSLNAHNRTKKVKSEVEMYRRQTGMLVFIAGALSASAMAMAAEPTDSFTGLPLHAALTVRQEVSSPVCGKPAQMNLYDAPMDSSLTEYVAWYKQRLKGFHYVHKVWSQRSQEMFYSPDGSRGISVTGTPDGQRVFAVTYMKIAGNLTVHQQDEFSPSNAGCK